MLFRVFGALSAFVIALPVSAQPATSSVERFNSEPAPTGRFVRHDLEALLGPDGDYFNDLDGWHGRLFTRPVGTRFAGLCRRTALIVDFESVRDEATQGTDLRAYAVHTRTQFKVISPELRFRRELELGEQRRFDGDCPNYDPGIGKGWFFADDEYVAARGFEVLMAAVARLRAGTSLVSDCEDQEACKVDIYSVANPDNLVMIDACDDEPEGRCFEMASEDDFVTVYLKGIMPPTISSGSK